MVGTMDEGFVPLGQDICTPRLRLRIPHMDDAAPLAALMTPEISRRLASWPGPCSTRVAEERIAAALASAARGQALPLTVECRATGRILGWVGLAVADALAERRIALLTYWLGAEFQGRGLMREAACAAVDAAWRRLRPSAIRAAVQSDNPVSIAVLRSLGMHWLGPGRIWCPAREREEACEYWEVRRPQEDAGLAIANVRTPPAAVPLRMS